MKQLIKIRKDLPLTFIGLKPMSDQILRTNIPVFPTTRHQSAKVPRKSFFKPISKMFYE